MLPARRYSPGCDILQVLVIRTINVLISLPYSYVPLTFISSNISLQIPLFPLSFYTDQLLGILIHFVNNPNEYLTVDAHLLKQEKIYRGISILFSTNEYVLMLRYRNINATDKSSFVKWAFLVVSIRHLIWFSIKKNLFIKLLVLLSFYLGTSIRLF